MTITEFIEAAAHNKIIQLVVLAIVCDTVFGIMRAARKKGMGKGAGVSGEVYGRTAGHRRTGRGQHHRQRRGTQDTGKIRIIRT